MVLIWSCTNSQNQKEFERLEIWEEFRMAAKEKRIDFLLENSKDTLECIECNKGENWILKEEFFKNHLKQIELSETKEYSVFLERYESVKGFTERYRITYSYRGRGKREEHNSIYTILKGENSIQFQGVFGVP